MIREEAILHFEENYVKEALEKNSDKFHEVFENNKPWFKNTLMKAIENMCTKLAEKNLKEDYKIKYLNFALLRTSVITQKYTILLSAYNESWYLDDYSTHMTFDLSQIFKSVLDELEEELNEKRKIYINKIEGYHVRKIVLEQAFKYYTDLELYASKVFQNIDEEPWFKEINKCDHYFIRWGEYKDLTHIVYEMNEVERSKEEFSQVLVDIEKEGEENSLVFSTWKNIDIDDFDIRNKNLMFINFKEANIKNTSIVASVLLGGNFKKVHLNQCNLIGCLLENATFEEGILENVSFENSNLMYADFTGVKFKNVDFKDSNLEKARFCKKDIPFINLSPFQLQGIVIEEDR